MASQHSPLDCDGAESPESPQNVQEPREAASLPTEVGDSVAESTTIPVDDDEATLVTETAPTDASQSLPPHAAADGSGRKRKRVQEPETQKRQLTVVSHETMLEALEPGESLGEFVLTSTKAYMSYYRYVNKGLSRAERAMCVVCGGRRSITHQ